MGALLSLPVLSLFITIVSSQKYRTSYVPQISFPTTPVHIKVKSRKFDSEDEKEEEVSLRTLVETRCQSLFTEFRPLWWLPNGHLQTLYTVMGDFSRRELMWYERTYLQLKDGGTLGLDFAPVMASELADDAPIIVVKHGLTGGSHESYVRSVLHVATAPTWKGGLGYRAVVVNFRGCAGVPVTSPQLYSAGHTEDLRQAVYHISQKYPKAPLIGLGFSLGASVMTRYLAEEGEGSRLNSGCTMACPWDLEKNSEALMKSFVGKHVYSKQLAGNLLKLVRRNRTALLADPEHFVAKAVPLTMALKNPTLQEFDNTFTRVGGGSPPLFPLASFKDYYRWGSSHYVLKDIRVPYLAINAADDPIVRCPPMDGGGNGYVVMELTPKGGHLGWFQSGDGYVDRWTTKPVLEWLRMVAEDVAHDAEAKKTKRLYVDEDGYVCEEGMPGLGCKEIEGGGVISGNVQHAGTLQGL